MKIRNALLPLMALTAVLFSCSTGPASEPAALSAQAADTVPRVTGIGGIFFGTENPEETRQWYGEHLGLAINEYGSPFEFRNAQDPGQINYLQWAPFRNNDEYMKPSNKNFMINYRVNNLDGLIRKLKAKGVQFTDSVAVYDYGRFVHIMDPFGNKLELWEPVDSALTKLGAKTTK